MTASLSASVIKFYLAESTNKRGFGRLSMESNWSILKERSYYVKTFWLCDANKSGQRCRSGLLRSENGSSSAAAAEKNARGRKKVKKKKKKTSGERL